VVSAEVVVRDGVELPAEQARALWRAFREHLDHTPGDALGFARAHGFAEARAERRRGRAVLRLDSAIDGVAARLSPGPVRAKASRAVAPSSMRSARGR
jgi:hypothetical protein